MTNLTIEDLTESRDLDHNAMTSFLGGAGAARGALFALWPASGPGSLPGVINNYVSNIFIESFQLNQLNQSVNISNSDNAKVNQLGNTENSNFKLLAESPSGLPALT